MGLYKLSQVGAVNAWLEATGTIAWKNEKVAAEACALVGSALSDTVASDDRALTHEGAYKIAQELMAANQRTAAAGYGPSAQEAGLRKAAAARDLDTVAVENVDAMMAWMDKQADALIMEGGQHTNRPGESPESIAKLDQHNRPQGEYLAGVGNTDMQVPPGAVIGREEPHPKAPANTAPTPNSITEHSKAAQLDALKTAAELKLSPEQTLQLLQKVAFGMGDIGAKAQGLGSAAMGAIKKVPQLPGDALSYFNSLPPEARFALLGGAGTGAVGAGVGAAAAPEGEGGLGALIGGAAGTALGAGGGALLGHGIPGKDGLNKSILPQPDVGYPGNPLAQAAEAERLGQTPPKPFVNLSPEMLQAAGADPRHNASQAASAATSRGGDLERESLMELRGHDLSDSLKLAAELKLNPEQTVALLNKIASGGSLTSVGKNTPEEAAKHDQVAKLDQQNRPSEKYHEGQGKTTMPNVGQQLHVEKREKQPGAKEKAPDTVPSRETKSAAYVAVFEETARAVGPYLPTHMDQNTKIAHVRYMMGLSETERADYLSKLQG
jgi:hypothetical protein